LLFSCAAESPADCYVVGYEELHADKEKTLAQLSAFLGVTIADPSGLIGATHAAKNVMTESESALVRSAFGAAIENWPHKRLTGPVTQLGNALDDCVRTIEPGRIYRCDAPEGDRGLLGTGWSGSEADGIRSDAPAADLFFRVPREGRYRLALDLVAEGPRLGTPQRIALTLGGVRFERALRAGLRARVTTQAVNLSADRACRARLELGDLRVRLRHIRFERA
jgi:hypothetical protein